MKYSYEVFITTSEGEETRFTHGVHNDALSVVSAVLTQLEVDLEETTSGFLGEKCHPMTGKTSRIVITREV